MGRCGQAQGPESQPCVAMLAILPRCCVTSRTRQEPSPQTTSWTSSPLIRPRAFSIASSLLVRACGDSTQGQPQGCGAWDCWAWCKGQEVALNIYSSSGTTPE